MAKKEPKDAAAKQLVKDARAKFLAADKARAKSMADFRKARKELLDAQDAAQIEANKEEVN